MSTNDTATKVGNILQYLESLPALQLADDGKTKENFIRLYLQTHPGDDQLAAEIFYQRESLFFKKILLANPKLQTCTRFSLYSCLIDVITNGATFDPAMKLMYIQMRGFNTAARGANAVWEQRAENKYTAEGELNLRMQLNQIRYADPPVIVYEGDVFRIGNSDKGIYVIWEANIPRKPKAKVIASWIKIIRPDGSVTYSYLTAEDYERFRLASEKQNNGQANALYSSHNGGIDPGFAATKTIRHAFRVFPKAKVLGSNTTVEDEEDVSEKTMVHDLGNKIDEPDNSGSGSQQPFTDNTGEQLPAASSNGGTPIQTKPEIKKPANTVVKRDINF